MKQAVTAFLTKSLFASAVLLLVISNSFGQVNYGYLQSRIQNTDRYAIPGMVLQSRSLPEYNYSQQVYFSGFPVTEKAEPAYRTLLDSIYEYKNFGYYFELYRWYYHYNVQQQADTVWRYYFNAKDEFEDITEIRIYNTTGQLLKLLRRQPDFWAWQYLGDSTIIDSYTEEYTYEAGYIVQKTTISRDFTGEQTTNEHFTYDEENKLIRSTLDQYDNHYETEYYYTIDGDLEYSLESWGSSGSMGYYSINNYEYEKTDSTRLITRNQVYMLSERPILDTISHWQMMDRFYETYDPSGRRTSLKLIVNDIYSGERISYKEEYSWTEYNEPLHTSHFKWEGTIDTGVWKETIRMDNTYDEEGNLQLYKKTFYDDRIENWNIDNSKTYYYSLVPVSLSHEIRQTSRLLSYPNPARDEIRIKNMFRGIPDYTVYTLYGAVIEQGRLENQSIPVSQLVSGIYIIEICDGTLVYSGKFIKQ
jgi:hypothetical protein